MPPVVPAKRAANEACAKDYAAVSTVLRDRGLLGESPAAQLLAQLRRAHRLAYGMYLWRHNLRVAADHKQVFLWEFASDAIQIIPHSLAGYRKTTALLLRGTIESVLRHVYYSDHQVEFLRANTTEWHISYRSLMEYMAVHPLFEASEQRFAAVATLKDLYGKLSRSVHAGAVDHMDMRKALRGLVFEQATFETQVDLMQQCAAVANYILWVYHSNEMRRFNPTHRQIILDSIPKEGRRVIAGL